MRLRHYSIHTERAYCDWIKRYVRYHGMTSRDDLHQGEAKIEAFLTHLAIDKEVAPSTQNQAMNALVFLNKREWGWQYVFSSRRRATDPPSAIVRRHHIDPSVINKAIKKTACTLGLTKRISNHTFRHSFATHV